MKNSIKHLLIWMLILSTGNFVHAQESTAAAGTTTIDCETSGTFKKKLSSRLCYPVSKYPSKQEATEKHLKNLLHLVGCNECPILPETFKCTPSIKHLIEGNLHLNSDKTDWCTKKSLHFIWACSVCRDVSGAVVVLDFPEEGLILEIDDQQERQSLIELIEWESEKDIQWKLYPNPTSGTVEVEVNTSQAVEELKLITYDIAGQLVYEKNYGNAPQGLFQSKADLSDLSNGWYLVSIYLDGELLGTEKIAISR